MQEDRGLFCGWWDQDEHVNGPDGQDEHVHGHAGLCQKNEKGGQMCPFPVNPLPLNKHCESSALIAMKVIYLCKLEWLLPLMMDQSLNVKVVHLVRDPRSMINSRIKESPSSTRVE